MIDERNPDPRNMPARRGVTPTQIALIVAALFIAAFAIWTFASTRRSNPDKLPDANSVTAAKVGAGNQKRCGSQATYDLIKRELFRRAAMVWGADQAAFGKLADYSVVRIDRPLLDSEDDQTGGISCSGSLTLDLPPGIAVTGGRRTLAADISYALRRSADGNGEVLILTSADAVINPLATIARVTSAPAVDPLAPTAALPQPAPGPIPAPPAPSARPTPATPPTPPAAPAPTFAARPSFNCANARTRGEIAVCGDSGLAALDRQMAAQYVDALRTADPGTRAALQRSRDRFLGYRDQCPSSACIAQTYRGRMREIRDIADGSIR